MVEFRVGKRPSGARRAIPPVSSTPNFVLPLLASKPFVMPRINAEYHTLFCEICNKPFKNRSGFTQHNNRFHPKSSRQNLDDEHPNTTPAQRRQQYTRLTHPVLTGMYTCAVSSPLSRPISSRLISSALGLQVEGVMNTAISSPQMCHHPFIMIRHLNAIIHRSNPVPPSNSLNSSTPTCKCQSPTPTDSWKFGQRH